MLAVLGNNDKFLEFLLRKTKFSVKFSILFQENISYKKIA